MTKAARRRLGSRRSLKQYVILTVFIALLTANYLEFHVGGFETFYAIGSIVRSGDGARLYDLPVQAAYQERYIGPTEQAGIPDLPFFYPAATAALFAPLTLLPVKIAFSIWAALNLALLVVSVRLLQRHLQIPQGYGPIFAASIFVPVYVCLLAGQLSILMLFLYTLAFSWFKRGKSFAAGIALGLGTLKFQLVLGFFAILLLRRCWKALAGAAAGGLMVALVSAAVLGWREAVRYPLTLMHSAHVPVFDRPQKMVSLYGLLTTTLGHYPSTWLLLLVSAGVIATASLLTRTDLEIAFSVAVVASILVAYHAFFYEFTLLLIPAAVIASRIERSSRLLSSYAMAILTIWALLLLVPIQVTACTTLAMIGFGLRHARSHLRSAAATDMVSAAEPLSR